MKLKGRTVGQIKLAIVRTLTSNTTTLHIE